MLTDWLTDNATFNSLPKQKSTNWIWTCISCGLKTRNVLKWRHVIYINVKGKKSPWKVYFLCCYVETWFQFEVVKGTTPIEELEELSRVVATSDKNILKHFLHQMKCEDERWEEIYDSNLKSSVQCWSKKNLLFASNEIIKEISG